MKADDVATRSIAELGRKYLWWDPVSDEPPSENRIIAQTMNFGTFDDIVILEQTVGKGPSINNRVIIATDREDLLSGIHNDGSRDVAWWDDSSRSGARRAEALSRDGPCSE
jgi:hypothetical protein